MKTCTKCYKEKPTTQFIIRKDRGVLMSWCGDCNNQRHTQYRQNNPQSYRNSQMKFKYNLTLDEWNSLLLSQGGRCAICKNQQPGHKNGWQTDHNHITKQVRGILCLDCNVVVGKVENGWKVEVPLINEYLDYYNNLWMESDSI